MSLKELLEMFDDDCRPQGAISFRWEAKDCGFGSMDFYIDEKDGYVHCDNEIMGREFLKRMLCHMVDNCVLDYPGSWDKATEGKPPGYPNHPTVDPK